MDDGVIAGLKRRLPHRALMACREAASWPAVLRVLSSRNKLFLRFAPPGHYYSPIPDLAEVRRNAERVFDPPCADDGDPLPGVDLAERAQLQRLEEFARFHDELPFPDRPTPGFRYHLDNDWFSYGDCVALYSILRSQRPRRIVEVGSGFSSAAMLDLDDRFFGGDLELTFIEPHPERLEGLLRDTDAKRCTIVRAALQDVGLDVFTELEDGDVLFVDSSHVAKVDSDVLHLFFRVLPALAPGVLVHFHDIPWPFEYPRTWLEQGKAWNEAYLLRAFLMYNPAFEIHWYAAFLADRHLAALTRALPTAVRPPSAPTMLSHSSIWLRKVSDRT
ncbi:class I SAM-dependent methyltransferase [Modestobacter sp. I12A-02662]|uniref:class I SAM-dependent methyltransferase n=1 Tax=Modestobacter sp. I12A-02662 TaxID=1730496 RepID=UPI0034DFE609